MLCARKHDTVGQATVVLTVHSLCLCMHIAYLAKCSWLMDVTMLCRRSKIMQLLSVRVRGALQQVLGRLIVVLLDVSAAATAYNTSYAT